MPQAAAGNSWPKKLTVMLAPMLLIGIMFVVGPARAAPPDPQAATDFIQNVADQAFGILKDQSLSLKARKDKLRELTKQEVALDYIGKLSLGRFNRPPANATPEALSRFKSEIAEYRSLFPDFAFEKMYNLVLDDLQDAKLQVTGTTPVRDTDLFVNTKILRAGKEPITADWRVRTDGKGQLKIIDVVAEGISLTITQRDDFSTMMSQGGLDKILKSMHNLIASGNSAEETSADKTSAISGDGEAPAPQ